VHDRRVNKSSRRTLNERRGGGSGTPVEPRPVSLPTPSGRPSRNGISEELLRLGYLRQTGVLSDEEFDEIKRRLLDGYWTDPASA
jgi:hypothetical protein